MQRKQFRSGATDIPVDLHPNGDVNVGATGTMSIHDFARLATSVLCASNTWTRHWVGFPVCNDLKDR